LGGLGALFGGLIPPKPPVATGLGVEPAALPEIAVDREVFRVLLGLLSQRPSLEEKWA